MVRKTKEEAAETRALLLDTAEKLFSANGVSRTSLADIATAAGLTRGAIYWHFENKVALFNAMADRICLPLEKTLDPDADGRFVDPLGQLHDALVQVLQDTETDEHQRRVFDVLFNKCEYTSEIAGVITRRSEAMIQGSERSRELLRQAILQGQLPPGLDIGRAELILVSFLGGLLNNWLFMPDQFSLREEALPLVATMIEMLKTSTTLRA